MFDESGGDSKSRVEEAVRLLEMIDDSVLSAGDLGFVTDLRERYEIYPSTFRITPRQLFWLRDIKDRSL